MVQVLGDHLISQRYFCGPRPPQYVVTIGYNRSYSWLDAVTMCCGQVLWSPNSCYQTCAIGSLYIYAANRLYSFDYFLNEEKQVLAALIVQELFILFLIFFFIENAHV